MRSVSAKFRSIRHPPDDRISDAKRSGNDDKPMLRVFAPAPKKSTKKKHVSDEIDDLLADDHVDAKGPKSSAAAAEDDERTTFRRQIFLVRSKAGKIKAIMNANWDVGDTGRLFEWIVENLGRGIWKSWLSKESLLSQVLQVFLWLETKSKRYEAM